MLPTVLVLHDESCRHIFKRQNKWAEAAADKNYIKLSVQIPPHTWQRKAEGWGWGSGVE